MSLLIFVVLGRN